MMIRMSAMRNSPVVCSGKQIGIMQNILLDEEQKSVKALIISCGIRGKRIALKRDILSISDDFILIKRDSKYQNMLEKNTCQFVRDTAGLLTGRITDYAIDKTNFIVYAIEIILGYTMNEHKKRAWIYDYQKSNKDKSELIIPISLGTERIISEEENVACECQP